MISNSDLHMYALVINFTDVMSITNFNCAILTKYTIDYVAPDLCIAIGYHY